MEILKAILKKFVVFNRECSNELVGRFPSIFGERSDSDSLLHRINADLANRKPETILEVGGIDRPLITKSPDYKYVGLDIEERSGCHNVYDQFLVGSVEDRIDISCDLLISRTLIEHVPDVEKAVHSMFACLNEGGTTHHYIPSRWHPYSVILRLVGPVLQKKLISYTRPETLGVTGYPAFFDNCSPALAKRLFNDAGFDDIRVKPYFRANGYFAFFVPAYVCVSLFENFCRYFQIDAFASGFVISATKSE